MKILGYRGKSWVSKAIQFQTRSEYSHVALMLDDMSVIEAWHVGGVVHRSSYIDGHTPGTPVDVFAIEGKYHYGDIYAFLKRQIGKKYDFGSVARFVTRRDAPANDKWFCSELVEEAMQHGDLPLLRGRPSHHAPRDTLMSPYLRYETTL